MNVALWVVQGLLAALFLFAGGAKLVLPLDQLAGPVALMNVVVALLAVFVAYGRWRLAPYRDSSRPSVLRPTR